MKLGCVLTASAFHFFLLMLWAAHIFLAACFETLQREGPAGAQDSGCHIEDDLTDPRDVDFHFRGYTFSEPFHLIVSYDWLILRSPALPIFEGDPLILYCQAWQDWPLTQITFYRDGSALGPPGPHREFSIAVAQEGDSGYYHCSGVFKSPGPGSPETASSVAITIQGPSKSAAPSSLNPASQESAAPKATPPEPPNSLPPPSVPSSEDPSFSSPLQVPDPHLYHQMGVLLKEMQDVRVLLGYLVKELRTLSHRLKLESPESPAKEM
ncbi:Fc receptor-like A isoform X5 [Talpa occidentalis]|uniref:Fc receptor-like A isoform X5 n=1 Tax=Talpa occidentalis TaxID=50954 RepID=UPI00188DFFC3|nr:Fc receptor-like A isoform X5 [Talpa occidentalis]